VSTTAHRNTLRALLEVDGPAQRRVLAAVAELLLESATGEQGGPRPSDEALLDGHQLDQQRRGLMPLTLSNRRRRIAAFMAWLAPRCVLDATAEDVQRYLDELELGNTARRNYLSHVSTFFDWCRHEGYLTEDPTARIVAPKREQGVPKPLSDAQLARVFDPANLNIGPTHGDDGRPLCAVCCSRPVRARKRCDACLTYWRRHEHRDRPEGFPLARRRLRCFLALGAFAGFRSQEIAGLHVEDVDPVARTLQVRRGKGGKRRTVPLHPEVLSALEGLPMPESGPMFVRAERFGGGAIEPHSVSHQINRYLRRIGVPGSAHALRHTFATRLYRTTRDLVLTQRLLGHSSVATTQIYADADMSTAADAVAALGVPGAR